MRTFADPHRCPDCGTTLPATEGPVCRACGLDLTGPLGLELFTTLSRADLLLAELRARSTSTEPATTPVAASEPVRVPAMAAAAAAAPTATAPVVLADDRAEVSGGPGVGGPGGPADGGGAGARLSAVSVPRILLGLGALCLLVAGLVFLAVTWSVMGVGGRTATLVALTAAMALLTRWTAGRALRGATEALGLVTLGLAALDVVGARTAGWLGTPSTPTFAAVLGLVLVGAGLGATTALARTPARGFTCGELVAVAGAVTFSWGLAGGTWADEPTRVLVALLAVGTLSAAVSRLLRDGSPVHRVAFVGVTTVAVLLWMVLVLTGLDRLGTDPSIGSVWGRLEGWPLLAAATLAGALAAHPRIDRTTRRIGLGAAILVLAVATTVPAYDEDGTTLTLAVLAVVAVLVAFLALAPREWATAGIPASAVGSLYLAAELVSLASLALDRYGETAATAWDGTTDGRLGPAPAGIDLAAAWTLPLLVVVLGAAGWAVTRLVGSRLAPWLSAARPPASSLAAAGGTLLAVTAAATLLLHPVPVVVVLVVLLGAGTVATLAGLVRDEPSALLCGGVLVALAQPLSWYDAWLTLAALGVALPLAVAVHAAEDRRSVPGPSAVLSDRAVAVRAAGGAVPPLLAGLVWTAGELLGVSDPWTGLVALVAVAAVGVGRHWLPGGQRTAVALPVELGAVLAGVGVGVAGVAGAALDTAASWTAVYLTVAGSAASAMALLRADRRAVGWLGGGMLVLATWVRLADLGVQAPEPYTLPSALALLVVGGVRLRRDPGASTARALTPGLSLALVPSLLWALEEPLSLRALLLGLACLALVVAGARLRWSAPLVHGAAVGTLLVLREAAPYVGEAVPRWALIGAAGAVLIALGITWEQRLQDARAVAGYLRRLR